MPKCSEKKSTRYLSVKMGGSHLKNRILYYHKKLLKWYKNLNNLLLSVFGNSKNKILNNCIIKER